MAILIGGERSGVGKTTVTLALLAGLTRRGWTIQSYKVGPDYIDPMFHRFVTGRDCRNLDPMLTSEDYVRRCFTANLAGADGALVEGVMGLFDGAHGEDDWASSAHIARLLNLPIVLVLDCSRLSHSVAALVQGYCYFDPRLQFAGLVLNRVGSDRHLHLLQSALAPFDIPILGVLRRQEAITIPDRHLGLVPTAELDGLPQLIERLADLGDRCFDWERLLPLVQALPLRVDPADGTWVTSHTEPVRIAIARDPAFSFYYADNLATLEHLGAELVPWSPLQDEQLPPDVQGLYLGGGFPEMFAQQLSNNQAARAAVRTAIQAGLPTYAECGGLMYLCQAIADFDRHLWPMAGVLPTSARMGQRLTLGYRRAIALQDTPLIAKGQQVCGHEFHRSYLTQPADDPLFKITHPASPSGQPLAFNLQQQSPPSGQSGQPLTEGWSWPNLHASYLHLHWGDRLELPRRFVEQCRNFNPTDH